MNTKIPRTRPDLLQFIEDITLPVLEKPLPDPAEDCYREQLKNKILLDQEDTALVCYSETKCTTYLIIVLRFNSCCDVFYEF